MRDMICREEFEWTMILGKIEGYDLCCFQISLFDKRSLDVEIVNR